MLINLSVNNLQTPINDPNNPLTTTATAVVKSAKMSKTMWLLSVFDVAYFCFLATYSFVPAIHDNIRNIIALESSDIRMSFWIVIIMNVVLISLYAIAEIVHQKSVQD